MNKLLLRTALVVCVLIIAAILGSRLILSDITAKIAHEESTYTKLQSEKKILQEKLKHYAGMTDAPATSTIFIKILKPGEESRLLKSVLSAASASSVIIRGFSLHEPWEAKKIQETNEPQSQSQPQLTSAELPQLDENGMPIGIATDDGEEEAFVEIAPATLQLEGRYASWGKFFDVAAKTLPLSAVQTMALELDGSGIVRGEVRLTFPLMKYGNASARR